MNLRSTALTASGAMLTQAPAAVRMMFSRRVHAFSASARSFYTTYNVKCHGERAAVRIMVVAPQEGQFFIQTLYEIENDDARRATADAGGRAAAPTLGSLGFIQRAVPFTLRLQQTHLSVSPTRATALR